MKNPDVKYFIGSEPGHRCVALPGGRYRLCTQRKTSLLAKDVGTMEAHAYCQRHGLVLPDPLPTAKT